MDVYKIAVGINMAGNVNSFLAAMGTQVLGVHAKVKDLENGLGRLKLAIGGALAVSGGVAILGTLKSVADHAKEVSKELATLKTQGLSLSQISGAQIAARQATVAVPGSNEAGNLKILSEAYSLMGLENAQKALPALSRTVQVFGAIDGNYKQATESLYSLLKSSEMMGKLLDEKTHLADPEKLTSFLDMMAKVAAATGNRVNARTLFGLVQQGAPALANMDDDGLVGMLMAAQQMGGPRAGTALTSLNQQFAGGTMTESRARELKRLGLIGDYTVGRGGHLNFGDGALSTDFAKSLEKNPLNSMAILKKAMESNGINGIEAQTKELFLILGRQTTQRLVSDFLRNAPNMAQEQGRIKGGQGLNDQASTRNAEDYSVAEHNMHEAWHNLMQAIAGPNALVAISVMNNLAGAINYLTDVTRNAKPETLQALAIGVGVLGAALTAGGAVALLAALGPAGWIAAGIVAVTAGFIAFKDPFENWVKSVTGMGPLLDTMDKKFNDAATAFGDFIAKIFKKIADALGGSKAIINGGKPAGSLNPGDELPGVQKQSFLGGSLGGAAIIKAAFSGADSPLAEGVYVGVLRAFKELMGGGSGASGFGSAGVQSASFSAGGVANDNIGGAIGRGLGQGGGSSIGGSVSGIPSSVQMTDAERNTLGLILKHESHGQNVMNYMGRRRGLDPQTAKGYTAQGYFQMLNSNWRRIAPRLGITAPNAMSASLEDQTRVALDLLRHGGVGNWSRYNPALRGALSRGDRAPSGPAPTAGPPPKPKEQPHITEVNLDGRVLTRVVTHRMAEASKFPKHVGGMDTHGSWRPPGTTLTDAA